MLTTTRRVQQLLKISQFATRRFASIATPKMDVPQPFEEEQLPWYKPEQFYPVRIGETLDSNYKVLGKLGYGAHSTVWLCRDVKYVDMLSKSTA
jgi:hypothetical protein